MTQPARKRRRPNSSLNARRDNGARRRVAPRFDTQDWDEATMLLAARSRMRCERCGNPLNGRGERHHRERRRDGGDRLANLLLLCTRCHGETHANPRMSREQGYIVSALAIVDPADVPVLQWGESWVLLDDTGHATRCDAPVLS